MHVYFTFFAQLWEWKEVGKIHLDVQNNFLEKIKIMQTLKVYLFYGERKDAYFIRKREVLCFVCLPLLLEDNTFMVCLNTSYGIERVFKKIIGARSI